MMICCGMTVKIREVRSECVEEGTDCEDGDSDTDW
jgi:hypothetical protein